MVCQRMWLQPHFPRDERREVQACRIDNETINFLPIHSLEKYLHEKIIVNKDADFFKEIGDRFFKVKSLKEVVDSLIKKNDDKAFYNYLIKNLKEQGIEENVFVQKVCEMIYRKEDMSKLLTFLQKTFQN